MIENYLKIAFPLHDFEFVYVDDFESARSGLILHWHVKNFAKTC